MFPELHESEKAHLELPAALPRQELHSKLVDLGVRSMDDFYFWRTPGKAKPWQGINLLSINLFLGANSVVELPYSIEEGQEVLCDRLELIYLLASHPVVLIDPAIGKINDLLSCLGGVIKVADRVIQTDELRQLWNEHAESLCERGWPPGSEELAIEIHNRYRSRSRDYPGGNL